MGMSVGYVRGKKEMINIVVLDIEANDLLEYASKLHCIAADEGIGTKLFDEDDEIRAFVERLKNADVIIGHNVSTFDLPLLYKFFKFRPKKGCKIIDTMLAGTILYPEMDVMSLEDWAIKLKLSEQKIQNEDWTVYTPLMGERCVSDVEITKKVLQYLKANKHWDSIESALLLEGDVGYLHGLQVLRGVAFNARAAYKLYATLALETALQTATLEKQLPSFCEIPGVSKKKQEDTKKRRTFLLATTDSMEGTCNPFKKDGKYNNSTYKYFDKDTSTVKGPYSKVSFRKLNLNSNTEVQEFLLSLGWVPTEWNRVKDKETGEWRTTSPKLTEDSFDSLPEGVGKGIARLNMLQHRSAFLYGNQGKSGCLSNRRLKVDNRVSAEAFTCGTNTGRYRHKGAVCNIPRVTTEYGKELRALFGVSRGKVQVGVDLSGIEIRCLAHYLLALNLTDAQKTADLILSPDKTNDFHSYNAEKWGVDRDTAKTCLYALSYGAGAKKLATILGRDEREGGKVREEFYEAHPAIKELNELLLAAYKRNGGWIKGIDGRPLFVRSEHKLLNTLLQNAAAVIFKRWMVKLGREWLSKGGIIWQIIAYHDELQFECEEGEAASWSERCKAASLEVGKEMGIKVPIAAETKSGANWCDCH